MFQAIWRLCISKSKRLLQTALDASMTDVDFSLRGCV